MFIALVRFRTTVSSGRLLLATRLRRSMLLCRQARTIPA